MFPKPIKKTKEKKFLKRSGKLHKVRKTSVGRAKNRAWIAFSAYIRTRDCLLTTGTKTEGKCFTCGALKPFELLDAGHFVAGRFNKFLLDERQVHAQCKYCNNALQGYGARYYTKMVDLFGESEVEKMLIENNILEKYSVNDWLDKEKIYKEMLLNL